MFETLMLKASFNSSLSYSYKHNGAQFLLNEIVINRVAQIFMVKVLKFGNCSSKAICSGINDLINHPTVNGS